MMMEIQEKGALLSMIGRLAGTMPAEIEHGFWDIVVEPLATLILDAKGALTGAERILLIAIAARAVRAAAQEQEAYDDAAAVIRRAGGAA